MILVYLVGSIGCSGSGGLRSIPGLTTKTKAVRTDDLLITLSRTECYGTCPVYELAIDPNGKVLFDGKKYTKILGQANGNIAASGMDELIEAFNAAAFLDLSDTYDQSTCPEFATDMSSVTISLRQNGHTKTVIHNLGCSTKGGNKPYPPGLRELESKIDSIAGSTRWIKGSE